MTTVDRLHVHGIDLMIDEYERFGGVMDFKLLRIPTVPDEAQGHLIAAKATLQHLVEKCDNYFVELSREKGTDRDDYFKVTINSEVGLTGLRIPVDVFFGPFFDLPRRKLISPDEQHVNEASQASNREYATLGFADAFIEPPHGLRTTIAPDMIEEYFINFCERLFGDLNRIIVYSWNTDSSNYFDDGKEWWGSFFWTVYNPVSNWYIGIAASTTD